MIWTLLPAAFVLGIVAGGLLDRLAARDARSVRHLRPRQQPALRVVIGGAGVMADSKGESPTEIGRLAMRVEGNFWVAYYALSNTMNGAILLGSIAMKGVADNSERKATFMAMMKDMVADILEERTGKRPDWTGERNAPEHERAGRG